MFTHLTHNRRRYWWVGGVRGLLLRSRPTDIGMHDGPWLNRVRKNVKRCEDDGQLSHLIARFPQDMTEGHLNPKRSRYADLLSPIGHVGHQDRRHPGRFKETCQHGHVDGTLWSGGCEEDTVDRLLAHAAGDLRSVCLSPSAEVRRKALIAHIGIVALG